MPGTADGSLSPWKASVTFAPHRGRDRVSQISPGRTAQSKQLDLEADP
jgi:hypothetical protein